MTKSYANIIQVKQIHRILTKLKRGPCYLFNQHYKQLKMGNKSVTSFGGKECRFFIVSC